MTNSTSTDDTTDNPYPYNPSFPVALVFAFLFSIVGIYHLFQYLRMRAWFLYFIILGIAMEALAYWARAYNSKNLKNFTSFSTAYFLVMLGPSVLAAGLYQTFGRLLYYTVPTSHRTFRSLLIPARFIAPFFVIFDVVSFFIQLIGLGIIVQNIKKNDVDAQKKGIDILRIGLILQTLVFGAFAVLAMRIVLISKRWQFAWPDDGRWKRLGWVVVLGSSLITFRAIYRIFEFTINNMDNYIANHEWPIYALDAIPMLILIVSFSLYHPGKYLPNTHISFNHAYKRLGNPGNKSSDPRFKGIELGYQAPHVFVQQPEESAASRAPPPPESYPIPVLGEHWERPMPQGMHGQGQQAYAPYRSRSPSPGQHSQELFLDGRH
ncbi:MAG: hypothetical protein Q9170_003431 [Blastenia crenularia]